MALSAQYAFNPSLASLTVYAYNLCGIRPTALTQQHMEDARVAANMLNSRWSAMGVNLWQVTLVTVPLIQGQATYSVATNVVSILDAYVSVPTGSAYTDRYIGFISRSEYAAISNKSSQGFPSQMWFNRQLTAPTITLYPTPDGNEGPLNYYCMLQLQDATMPNDTNVDIPFYFMDAFGFALALRLALIWAPEKVAMLKGMADEAWTIATNQNVENSAIYISPMMGSYWRT